VGALLLLNFLGVFKTFFGIDTAILIALLAGYKTFCNALSALLEKRISADLALCIAVAAALCVGQNLAAAEAMFIVLVGKGLESYAAVRTTDAIEPFFEQMPRTVTLLPPVSAGSWKKVYNQERLHAALGYLPPAEFERGQQAQCYKRPLHGSFLYELSEAWGNQS
jgi:cation transport ATPase